MSDKLWPNIWLEAVLRSVENLTLGAIGFHAQFFFSQVLKSDPCKKPLDQTAIPLIVLGQLQVPCLYQNIQILDVLLIGSLEMLSVSNAPIGLQSQYM